jgi:hypothetical protein
MEGLHPRTIPSGFSAAEPSDEPPTYAGAGPENSFCLSQSPDLHVESFSTYTTPGELIETCSKQIMLIAFGALNHRIDTLHRHGAVHTCLVNLALSTPVTTRANTCCARRILGVMPMVAMFIIFDFVIYNPLHAEARKNLAYLDIVSAHYARLDLASQGTLHDSMVAEFTSIARAYINESSAARDNRANDVAMSDDANQVSVPSYGIETIQQPPEPSAPPILGDGSGQEETNLVSHVCHFLLVPENRARVALAPSVF